jgi:archaellum component FlaG (FlaF/FlaG flagellin family)
VYWKNQSTIEDARREMAARTVHEAHSNLTMDGTPAYDGGAGTYSFTVKNAGETTFDIRKLEYIVDGVITYSISTGWPKVEGGAVTNTNFLLPGETMDVRLDGVASEPTHLKVTTEFGVGAYYP